RIAGMGAGAHHRREGRGAPLWLRHRLTVVVRIENERAVRAGALELAEDRRWRARSCRQELCREAARLELPGDQLRVRFDVRHIGRDVGQRQEGDELPENLLLM